MRHIDDIADEILAREGGYVDDPDDLGGPTNYGVTLKTLQGLGLDLDADGDVDTDDLKQMTHDRAREISEACALAQSLAPAHLVDAYGIARRNYYYATGDKRSASRKFAVRRDGGKGGWITRAESFISPRYHLSDAEHRARVATWR